MRAEWRKFAAGADDVAIDRLRGEVEVSFANGRRHVVRIAEDYGGWHPRRWSRGRVRPRGCTTPASWLGSAIDAAASSVTASTPVVASVPTPGRRARA